jgi:hypothetical protein
VETAEQIVERTVLAPLRNLTFTSLADLNDAIREQLDALNHRPFQKLEGTRRSLFDATERAALKPLPAERYEYGEWREAKVNIDYHIASRSTPTSTRCHTSCSGRRSRCV